MEFKALFEKAKTRSTKSVVPKVPSPYPKQRQGTCSICSENNQNLVTLSKNCKHEAACCVPCLTQNISSTITSKGIYRFECPSPTCNVEFEPSEYFHLLDARLTTLVDKLLLNRFLESNEEFRWCKSKKGCGAGQLVSNYQDLLGYVMLKNLFSLVLMCLSHIELKFLSTGSSESLLSFILP